MPETEAPTDLTAVQYTHAQLHRLACITCGRTDGRLLPTGHVYTPGDLPNSRLGWPVVACPEHQGGTP